MKLIVVSLVMLLTFFAHAQTVSFNFGDLKMNFVIIESDSIITETIYIENVSNSSLYVPVIQNHNLFFFTAERSLFSFCGVINTKYGPNIGGYFLLEELKPSEKRETIVRFHKKGCTGISDYHFSMDYLTGLELKAIKLVKQRKSNSNSVSVPSVSYAKIAKFLYSSYAFPDSLR